MNKAILLLRCSKVPLNMQTLKQKKLHQVHFCSQCSVSNIIAPSKIANVVCCSEPKSEVKRCTKFNTRGRESNDTDANQVSTYNRYELLHEGGGVVLCQPDSDISYPGCDHNLKDDDNIDKNNVKLDISDCCNASNIDAAFKTCTKAQPKVAVHSQLVNKSPLEAEMQSTSKYDLPLHFKNKNKNRLYKPHGLLPHPPTLGQAKYIQIWLYSYG